MPHADAPPPHQRMRHGYCNVTSTDGSLVTKRFVGPQATKRASTEIRVLRAVSGAIPVPVLESVTEDGYVCRFVDGRHGQDLLSPDTAAGLFTECGRILRRVHDLSVGALFGSAADDAGVLVHGDFGPQNLLFDATSLTVAAVLDWEWAHVGAPVEDLAWCEWIIRMHHADCADALPHLYHGYGAPAPSAERRQAAMVAKCRAMRRFGLEARDGSATEWERRLAITSAWRI